MKDFLQIWNRVANGRPYSAVSTSDRELKEFTKNRIRKSDIHASNVDQNECDGLNAAYDDNIEFRDKKEAIISRLFDRRKGKGKLRPKNLFIFLLLGFIGFGIALFILLAHPYDVLFKLKVVFAEGGEIYEMWRKPEVDLYVRIYLFNVTNADRYMKGLDDKVHLQQVGPYVYKELLEHRNVSFNRNGTLSAVPAHPLQWVGSQNDGLREEDVLMLPNIALLSIANVASKKSFLVRSSLDLYIRFEAIEPLVNMTVRQFLFDYESPLVSLGNQWISDWIKFEKLGLIDRMYDFEGDFETVFTGESDVTVSGLIDTYRGSPNLQHWRGEHCSNVRYSSDGTKFKGPIRHDESLLFYRKSLCRPAPLVPVESGVKSGISALKYVFPEHMLDNGRHDKRNKCYCREGRCLPEGLVDVTDCYYGFPIALSYPHFYQGDDILFANVTGLQPDKEKHETRMWINPEAGLPVDVAVRIQINMAIEDVSSIHNCQRFSNMYLPLLWFEFRMFELPPKLEDRFRLYLNVLPVVENGAMYTLFIVGSTLILTTIYRLAFNVMFKSYKNNKKSNLKLSTDLFPYGKRDKIYTPCEIPMSEAKHQNADENLTAKRQTFIRTQSDRFKAMSSRIGDKVYDSVGSIKDRMRDLPHIQKVFDRAEEHERFVNSSDSDEGQMEYSGEINMSIEDLEVLDDGSQFDEVQLTERRVSSEVRVQRLNNLDNDLILDLDE